MYVLILYSYMLYEILNESDLIWTGLTQIVDIDKGEIELSSAKVRSDTVCCLLG